MQPVISVIIPTLNEENYLPRLLEDLAQQSEKNFEVIIVDAHSEDNTKQEAEKFRDKLDLHFIESPKRLLAFQRNYGAEHAHGEYLFFLDADTQVAPEAIKNAVRHVTTERFGVYLPVIKSSNPKVQYSTLVNLTVLSVRMLQKIGKPLSIGPLILIKKELFDKIGHFSERTTASEDHNLIIKAYQLGEKAHFISDVQCLFSMRRLERDGIMNTVWKYTKFTAETLVKGGVYGKSNYVMGGQNYSQATTEE